MSRPKKAEQEQFRHLIRVRVNDAVYERMTNMQKQSDCRSICEMARKILSGKRITLVHKDVSLNDPRAGNDQKGIEVDWHQHQPADP